MKKLVALLIVIFQLSQCIAQTPAWKWAHGMGKSPNDQANGVACDLLGNSYTTGYFTSDTADFGTLKLPNNGANAFCLVKHDSTGQVIWGRTHASGVAAEGKAVTTDNNGNVIVAGSYLTDVVFGNDTLRGMLAWFHTFLVKYDASGNQLWAKRGFGNRDDTPYDLTTDASGNVIVIGDFSNDTLELSNSKIAKGNYANSMFIAKLDAGGNVQWNKNVGSNGSIRPKSVATDLVGNVYVTGYFADSVLIFDGTPLFNTNTSQPFLDDIFVAKYSPSGNLLWVKKAGGNNGEQAFAIAVEGDGHFYIAGRTTHGTVTFGTQQFVCISDTIFQISSPYDAFIARYDADGNCIWAHSEGGWDYDGIKSIAVDGTGNLYTAMETTYNTKYVSGIAFNDGARAMMIKQDTNGKLIWAKGIDEELWANSIAVDPNGNAYLAGGYWMNTAFDNDTLYSNSVLDFFVAKLGDLKTSVVAEVAPDKFKIYPNPTTGIVNISVPVTTGRITVYNIIGKQILQTTLAESGSVLNLSSQSKGLYWICIEHDNLVYRQKVLLR